MRSLNLSIKVISMSTHSTFQFKCKREERWLWFTWIWLLRNVITDFCQFPDFSKIPSRVRGLTLWSPVCLVSHHQWYQVSGWRLVAAVATAELSSAWPGHNICRRCANTASALSVELRSSRCSHLQWWDSVQSRVKIVAEKKYNLCLDLRIFDPVTEINWLQVWIKLNYP